MTRALNRLALYAAVLAVAALVATPMYWLVISAFKSSDEIFTSTPRWLPAALEWHNFGRAWQGAAFGRYFLNSTVVALAIVFLQLATSSLAAYALARRRFVGRTVVLLAVIGALIIPIQVTFLANFITLQHLGWLDSYWALVAPFTASAFGTFLLRQAFLAVPEAMEDAARLDRCTGLAFLWHFLLPLSRPTVLAFTLVALVTHWNDYFWPLIVTNRDEIRTLPIGLAMFVTQEVMSDWNLLMAATLFVAAPMLIIFFLTQRYFIRSHMHAGLKG
ncbi:MAG TPA: carbohydrate ABC transporter permease [Alphaproteobacteria bacterium]|nr:carbohydrate ABC transporter permease [Alphaproteobacteria bacterium]